MSTTEDRSGFTWIAGGKHTTLVQLCSRTVALLRYTKTWSLPDGYQMFIRSEELLFQIWGFASDTMLWGKISPPPPAAPLGSDWTSQKAVDWKNHNSLGTYGSRGLIWSGMMWPIGEESIWCRTCHGLPCRSQCWSHSGTLQRIKQSVRSLPVTGPVWWHRFHEQRNGSKCFKSEGNVGPHVLFPVQPAVHSSLPCTEPPHWHRMWFQAEDCAGCRRWCHPQTDPLVGLQNLEHQKNIEGSVCGEIH